MNEEEQSAKGNEQQASSKTKSENENLKSGKMEVHHHPHLPHGKKKKFKQYFLEFLMIFLAVTLGFFAESYREHIVNKSKETDYMKSMLADLRNDSVKLNVLKLFHQDVQANYDSVSLLLKNPVTLPRLLKAYYLTAAVDDMLNFDYSNRTVSQLKSSGDFRLIKSKEVADGIIDYDAFVVNNYSQIQGEYANFYGELEQMRENVFDYQIFNKLGKWDVGKMGTVEVSFFKQAPLWGNDSAITKMIEMSDKAPAMLNQKGSADLFSNKLQAAIRLIDYGLMFGYITIQEKNTALIQVIQQKYHLQ